MCGADHDLDLLCGTAAQIHRLCGKVIKYIREHLSDSNLSLKWISENYAFMNPDYVSKMFVKQTGSKFSAYVTELRIQEAKKLLLEHSEKNPYAVAEMVGSAIIPVFQPDL